jgi:endonuclease/exonuclease/phosphatase family metal-dependent hydrolase
MKLTHVGHAWIIYSVLTFSLILFSAEKSSAETVQVLTYNAGLLHKAGVDFVACVKPRTTPQVREVFSIPQFNESKPFVITLQEVWTERAYKEYSAEAKKRGLKLVPSKFDDIKNNGQMTITNLPLVAETLIPFSTDSHVRRGLRVVDVKLKKQLLRVINVHTTYSDSKRYSANQIQQFNDLALYLNDTLKSFKGQVIVTGDLNAGPNVRYHNQKYDPAKVLWFDWLLPMFTDRGFTEAVAESNTWDEINPLVAKPTAVIQVVNSVNYGIANWEEKTSRLDHIFVSKGLRVLDSRLALNKTVDLNRKCAERSDERGYTYLSDHFGILAAVSAD